ncbi:uncharacterized protein LOC131551612 [Onychostoma macrolepis]|uniref:uncharacterized protein LOC131551612 n=1 Tax=Onychostoma macrolepis TaxID=369639 RepID=UPI00272B927A|nr:uncharacterized protein LOC131551612 [Onychostoma macrolepis]
MDEHPENDQGQQPRGRRGVKILGGRIQRQNRGRSRKGQEQRVWPKVSVVLCRHCKISDATQSVLRRHQTLARDQTAPLQLHTVCTLKTRSLLFSFQVTVAIRSSLNSDQMVDQNLEMTSAALNVSGDHGRFSICVLVCTCVLVDQSSPVVAQVLFQFKVHIEPSTVQIPGCVLAPPPLSRNLRQPGIPECISHQSASVECSCLKLKSAVYL